VLVAWEEIGTENSVPPVAGFALRLWDRVKELEIEKFKFKLVPCGCIQFISLDEEVQSSYIYTYFAFDFFERKDFKEKVPLHCIIHTAPMYTRLLFRQE